ncbi:hypothetical protein Acsp05_58620 [Actinokineospora sp. NBRC 105648]|nr:hypothetical protein Acsp05_58620 [Actinokineospora sp. NBRC 105648]
MSLPSKALTVVPPLIPLAQAMVSSPLVPVMVVPLCVDPFTVQVLGLAIADVGANSAKAATTATGTARRRTTAE